MSEPYRLPPMSTAPPPARPAAPADPTFGNLLASIMAGIGPDPASLPAYFGRNAAAHLTSRPQGYAPLPPAVMSELPDLLQDQGYAQNGVMFGITSDRNRRRLNALGSRVAELDGRPRRPIPVVPPTDFEVMQATRDMTIADLLSRATGM